MTAHPFEISGLGIGPFRFLYCASLPSPSMAGHNPEAYNNALRSLPRDVPLGTCAHCGMALMHNFICQSSDGRKFAVGSACVAKTADKALGDKIAIAAAKVVRAARRAKAEAKRDVAHKAWLIANAPRLEAEAKARVVREAGFVVERTAVIAKWAFLLPVLDSASSEFCQSVADSIRAGHAPLGRAVAILETIYAKAHGRRGSAAYNNATDEFHTKIGTV